MWCTKCNNAFSWSRGTIERGAIHNPHYFDWLFDDNIVDQLNPMDPSNGGNHNHKAFSVFIYDNLIWVGTANGINKGEINDDCISWTHVTVDNGISGNWVIDFEFGFDRIWAISWST